MLDIDMVSSHGYLFVRLFGKLNKTTIKKYNQQVTKLLYELGINNIVINIQNLSFDKDGLNCIRKTYKICPNSRLCVNLNQIEKLGNMKYIVNEKVIRGMI